MDVMTKISNQNWNYSSMMKTGSGGVFRKSFPITYTPSVSPTFSSFAQSVGANKQNLPLTSMWRKKKCQKARHQKINIVLECKDLGVFFFFSLFVDFLYKHILLLNILINIFDKKEKSKQSANTELSVNQLLIIPLQVAKYSHANAYSRFPGRVISVVILFYMFELVCMLYTKCCITLGTTHSLPPIWELDPKKFPVCTLK